MLMKKLSLVLNLFPLNIFGVAVFLTVSMASGFAADRIESPDGKVAVEFQVQPGGFPTYKVEYSGKPIVTDSRLGFEPDLTNAF